MTTEQNYEEIAIDQANQPAIICGAILFIDISNYLVAVRNLTPTEEWCFVEPMYLIVEEICSRYDFHLSRTFGDGFLLFTEVSPDEDLLIDAGRMLNDLHERLKGLGFSFKASLIGGSFMKVNRVNRTGLKEIVLCGSIVNYAAKKLSITGRGVVYCSWPGDDRNRNEITFGELIQNVSGRGDGTVDLDNISRLNSIIAKGATTESSSKDLSPDKPDYIEFASSVKTFVLEVTKLADDKAKTVFTIDTALLVYLFNGQKWPTVTQVSAAMDIAQWGRLALLVLAVCVLVVSAAFALAVLVPRMWTNFRGYVFFGSIASWSSAEVYADEVMKLNADSIRMESIKHNYEISKVTASKFVHLRRCLIWMAIGVMLTLAFLFANWAVPILGGQ
ncbi:MAG: hypothetical protein KJ914_18765 [Gammaproteobacteria bacterium]|nr:hypothetical protein [Gammaproteobacteria bacterium]MBU1716513.1 hypothetical protein [Pseudomonadota bacterium]